MEYRRLGRTDLKISSLCLGTMTFGGGDDMWGLIGQLQQEQADELVKIALEAGINFIDTANIYGFGASERIVGQSLKNLGVRREDVVLATKVLGPMGAGPNARGASRGHIMSECKASLARLQTDYIDLYQIHRWDDATPIEETMEALHDIVKAGKARYIGASSMFAWQFAKAQEVARANGWTRFIAMQNHVNLLYREEEREMLPLCADQGVGVIPWSPLARGRLARAWDETTVRSETDGFGKLLYRQQEDADRAIVEAVGAIAADRGVSRATVALAWHFAKGVTAPIIGATKPGHIGAALEAVTLGLTDEEVARLEAPYLPKAPVGVASTAPRDWSLTRVVR